jgi:hypothetical protein
MLYHLSRGVEELLHTPEIHNNVQVSWTGAYVACRARCGNST